MPEWKTLYLRVRAETADLIEQIAREEGRRKVDVVEELVSAGLETPDLAQDLAHQLKRVMKLEQEVAEKSTEIKRKTEQLSEISDGLPSKIRRGMEEFSQALQQGIPCECGGLWVMAHLKDGEYKWSSPCIGVPAVCRGETTATCSGTTIFCRGTR